MVLCRDARDSFDKQTLEARKIALESARKQWESSVTLSQSNLKSIKIVNSDSLSVSNIAVDVVIKNEDKNENESVERER